MIKKIAFSLLFFIVISAYSQNEQISNYKYVIVSNKFDFLKHADQYQTSSLTKFLLKKKGFTVFLSNETLPEELVANRCLALIANVTENSSLFSVKTKIDLKDCYGKSIYTSKEGKSKEKDFKKSYHEAIRMAYSTMSDLEYKYEPKKENKIKATTVVTKVLPVKKSIPLVKEDTTKQETVLNVETLYAQTKPNGFQLVNTKPEILFQVLNTNVKDVFIIKSKNGILYKSDTIWIAEYYENNTFIVKKYNIKF